MVTEAKTPSSEMATKKPRRALLGKKLGMTQLFLKEGQWVPVTVLKVGPCTVLQVKTPEKDGYAAVQLGFDETKKHRKRPQQAVLDRLGVKGMRLVREVPFLDPKDLRPPGFFEQVEKKAPEASESQDADGGTPKEPEAGKDQPKADLAPGVVVGVSVFQGVKRVDVRGVSKGRGFAGVIRRHHFSAGPKSHGTKNIREPGSTGMHTDPARVIPGKKMPGHMGAVTCKVRNLDVVKLEEDGNLLVVKGAVPGPKGAYVYIEESLV